VPLGNTPAAAAPSPAKPAEATIEDVPTEARQLADSILGLLRSLGSREDLGPAAKKALQDANAKLPFVFAAFRDKTVDADLLQGFTLFIQKLLGSDAAGANAIRKQFLATHITKSRDVVVWMSYIVNAMK
jgi:hypothetical protein